ncbi:MAG: DUF1788 domain-containing protein [Chloroflexota bacterium]|nr:DUF1788 domain-containing protein [Chloroflexota bacterium]
MRRTLDEALIALRHTVDGWARGDVRPDVRVFVYPPEREVEMLARLRSFVQERAMAGQQIALLDVGTLLLQEVERRVGMSERLAQQEERDRRRLAQDLEQFATRAVRNAILAPHDSATVCRLLLNTGTLATTISYSALLNDIHDTVTTPSILAFPGEGDERSLNLLGLRSDTSYRVPRI